MTLKILEKTSKTALFTDSKYTRTPARTAVGLGGLLNDLDDDKRSHVAIQDWMVPRG